ncbi:MAG: hypothetical protein MUE85_15290, partial [Microscillaceae bacterium]|nr:hypothetical protein [Microscillaceae bacterium]
YSFIRLFVYSFILVNFLTSCQKDPLELHQKPISSEVINTDVSLKSESYLVVNSESAYETLLNNPSLQSELIEKLDKKSSFISMNDFYKSADLRNKHLQKNKQNDSQYPPELPIENDFLASIVNPDGIIQIGKHIFKIIPFAQRVLVLPSPFSQDYNDLLINNTKNERIMVFSTSESVL